MHRWNSITAQVIALTIMIMTTSTVTSTAAPDWPPV